MGRMWVAVGLVGALLVGCGDDEVVGVCGDGVVGPGEECDGEEGCEFGECTWRPCIADEGEKSRPCHVTFTVDHGSGVQELELADIDGDGYLDVVTADTQGRLAVLRGDGSGSFEAPVPLSPLGDGSRHLTLEDFDGDGAVDIATIVGAADSFDRTVHVLLNDGGGRFEQETILGGAVGMLWAIASADMDLDGDVDLIAIGSPNAAPPRVAVYRNDGAGVFENPEDTPAPWEGVRLSVADVNGDGTADVAVATAGGFLGITVYVNTGDAVLVRDSDVEAGTIFSIVLADVDGDERPDLVTTDEVPRKVRVRWNDGNGKFTDVTDYAVGSSPRGLAAGDIDGNGTVDLAITADNVVTLAMNRADGTFAFVRYEVPSFLAIDMGDLNGDGILDVVTGSLTVILSIQDAWRTE